MGVGMLQFKTAKLDLKDSSDKGLMSDCSPPERPVDNHLCFGNGLELLTDHRRPRRAILAFLISSLCSLSIMVQSMGIGLVETNQPQFAKFYDHSYALIIGIDKYENEPELKYATNDAKSVANMLTDQFGFDPKDVKTLLAAKATKEGISRALGLLRSERIFLLWKKHLLEMY